MIKTNINVYLQKYKQTRHSLSGVTVKVIEQDRERNYRRIRNTCGAGATRYGIVNLLSSSGRGRVDRRLALGRGFAITSHAAEKIISVPKISKPTRSF